MLKPVFQSEKAAVQYKKLLAAFEEEKVSFVKKYNFCKNIFLK